MKALSIAAAMLAAGSAAAQTTNVRNVERNLRDIQTVDDNKAKASTFYSHKLASAKRRIAADSGKGLAATANVVHQTNSDFDATGFIAQLEYSRSSDGGRSFKDRKVIHKLTQGETWDGNQTHSASKATPSGSSSAATSSRAETSHPSSTSRSTRVKTSTAPSSRARR